MNTPPQEACPPAEAALESAETRRTNDSAPLALREMRRNLYTLSVIVGKLLEQKPAEVGSDSQVTADQMRVLRFIACNHRVRVGEVARGLGVKASSASLALDRLENKGLVRRLADTRDRRTVRLELTRAGEVLFQRVEEIVYDKLLHLGEALGEEQTLHLIEQTGDLIRGLMEGESPLLEACFNCNPSHAESCAMNGMFGACRYAGDSQSQNSKAVSSVEKPDPGSSLRLT